MLLLFVLVCFYYTISRGACVCELGPKSCKLGKMRASQAFSSPRRRPKNRPPRAPLFSEKGNSIPVEKTVY